MVNPSNLIGNIGEELATELMPSASLVRETGYDLLGLAGERIEVKTSSYSKKRLGWRFKLSVSQVLTCTHVLLLALDLEGRLCSYWLIPGDELRSKEININYFNLATWGKYLVDVINPQVKWCSYCLRNLPETNFRDHKTVCTKCLPKYKERLEKRKNTEYNQKYYLAHKDKIRAQHKSWHDAHPYQPKEKKEIIIPEEKTCTKCGVSQPLDNYRQLKMVDTA